jgi:hypothetical protein
MLQCLVKVPENSRTQRVPGIFLETVLAKRLQAGDVFVKKTLPGQEKSQLF